MSELCHISIVVQLCLRCCEDLEVLQHHHFHSQLTHEKSNDAQQIIYLPVLCLAVFTLLGTFSFKLLYSNGFK